MMKKLFIFVVLAFFLVGCFGARTAVKVANAVEKGGSPFDNYSDKVFTHWTKAVEYSEKSDAHFSRDEFLDGWDDYLTSHSTLNLAVKVSFPANCSRCIRANRLLVDMYEIDKMIVSLVESGNFDDDLYEKYVDDYNRVEEEFLEEMR